MTFRDELLKRFCAAYSFSDYEEILTEYETLVKIDNNEKLPLNLLNYKLKNGDYNVEEYWLDILNGRHIHRDAGCATT